MRIKLCILNKIPILSIKVTKKLIEKLKIKEKFKKIDINNLEEDKNIFRKILEITKTNSLKIENLDLKIELGTECNFRDSRHVLSFGALLIGYNGYSRSGDV